MQGRPTDHRNLDLNQLNLDVAFGRAGGKVIWQPRILAWIDDRHFFGKPLPAPYTGMTPPAIYRSLGCSNRIYEFNACFRSEEDPAVRITQTELNATDYEVLVETPVGTQKAAFRRTVDTPWHLPLKWWISSEEEMKVATWREARRTWRWDQAAYDRNGEEWRGLGAPCIFMPRVNVQRLFIDDMGIEAGSYALMDWPATVEAYFEAVAESHERMIEIINASPIQIVNFGDNVHSSTLPPPWFEQYVLPVYQRRSELLHRAGKFVYAHWDGDTKPLLPYARDTGMDGIEAITPLPQGDVTLEEVKAALGDMFLIDGIPAVYFDDTYPERTLIECAKKCIDLFAPHLILGISDEISSQGDIERVRLVGEVVDDYNASL
ncbi:MAG TPA: uroporphyrinogen decarboxylase family protein [Fimbriimonadaceae bacterium]|nr:uroporphyrinogen decarboxylase family protein [Fimbriimonadaceae bacterium]